MMDDGDMIVSMQMHMKFRNYFGEMLFDKWKAAQGTYQMEGWLLILVIVSFYLQWLSYFMQTTGKKLVLPHQSRIEDTKSEEMEF